MKIQIWGLGYLVRTKSGTVDLDDNIMSYFKSFSGLVKALDVWLPLPKGYPPIIKNEFKIHYYQTNRFSVFLSGLRLLFNSTGSHIYLYMPAASRISFFVPLYKLLGKSLTIYLADDPYALTASMRLSGMPFVKSTYLLLVKQYLKLADQVIVRGQYLETVALKYNSKVNITAPITQLVDYKGSQPFKKDKPFNIVVLGRLTWDKGFKVLLNAFAKFLIKRGRDATDYKLIIAGDGPDAKAIKDYSEQLKLKDFVIFIGWIMSKESKIQFWQKADLHVLATINTEGVPRSIDEAIINQVPTISSAIGGIPFEYNANEIYLVKPNDVSELVRAFEKMLDSREYNSYQKKAEKRRNYLLSLSCAAKQHYDIIRH